MALRSNLVQSVERALDILECLGDGEPATLGEVAERACLTPSTAHRLLATLASRGYVQQRPDSGRYLLSYRIVELSSSVESRTAQLRATLRPYLDRVRKMCGETTNLSVLDLERGTIVFVDQAQATSTIRVSAEIGRSIPAHATAAGKAELAFNPPERIEAYRMDPRPLTQRTIVDRAKLLAALPGIRTAGYAMDDEEHAEGVTCVAAPVLDRSGIPCAALSVSGPTSRIRHFDGEDGILALGELLVLTARDASAALGHSAA
jgi:DNA-binding IclR family transcriptional regulator